MAIFCFILRRTAPPMEWNDGDLVVMLLVSASEPLAFFWMSERERDRVLGLLFAVTFRAPYLRCLVLCNCFGALK